MTCHRYNCSRQALPNSLFCSDYCEWRVSRILEKIRNMEVPEHVETFD